MFAPSSTLFFHFGFLFSKRNYVFFRDQRHVQKEHTAMCKRKKNPYHFIAPIRPQGGKRDKRLFLSRYICAHSRGPFPLIKKPFIHIFIDLTQFTQQINDCFHSWPFIFEANNNLAHFGISRTFYAYTHLYYNRNAITIFKQRLRLQ